MSGGAPAVGARHPFVLLIERDESEEYWAGSGMDPAPGNILRRPNTQ